MSELPHGYGVYIVASAPHDGRAQIKIGMTGNMRRRMYALKSSVPFPVRFCRWFACGDKDLARHVESHLLQMARDHLRHSRGEWYETGADLVGAVGAAIMAEAWGVFGDTARRHVTKETMRRRGLVPFSVKDWQPLGARQGYQAICEGYFATEIISLAMPFGLPSPAPVGAKS